MTREGQGRGGGKKEERDLDYCKNNNTYLKKWRLEQRKVQLSRKEKTRKKKRRGPMRGETRVKEKVRAISKKTQTNKNNLIHLGDENHSGEEKKWHS